MAGVDPLVSTAWLKEQLDQGKQNVVLLDSTWDEMKPTTENNIQLYTAKHIPGAIFFDMNNCIKPRPTCARNLQDVTEFTEYARRLGISSNTHVIVCDRGTLFASTKVWWIFRVFGHERVSVLDGGVMKWEADGYPLASGVETSSRRGDFEVHLNREMIVEYDEMLDIVRTGRAQILDCRLPEDFSGHCKEPVLYIQFGLQSMNMPIPDSMQAGHMAGARNISALAIFKEGTNLFKSKEELAKLFKDGGIDLDKPLVTTCYMGHSASFFNLAAALCGYHRMKLYYGSWTEFGQIAPADLIERNPKEN